jgi:hypothetical protein
VATEHADAAGSPRPRRPETIAEQIDRKGVHPITSVDELRADAIWESDDEVDEFLASLQARRQLPLG